MTLHVPVSVYPTNLDNIAVVSHILMVPVVDLSQYQVCWHNRRRMKHFVNIAQYYTPNVKSLIGRGVIT